MQNRDMAANRLEIGQLVARKQEAGASFPVQFADQREHLVHSAGVEPVEGFIEQDQPRRAEQPVGDRNPPPVAKRELADAEAAVAFDAEQALDLGAASHRPRAHPPSVFEALAHGQMRRHAGAIENGDDIALQPEQFAGSAFKHRHIAFLKRLQAQHAFDGGGLARAVESNESEHGGGGEVEINPAQHRRIAIALAQPAHAQNGIRFSHVARSPSYKATGLFRKTDAGRIWFQSTNKSST